MTLDPEQLPYLLIPALAVAIFAAMFLVALLALAWVLVRCRRSDSATDAEVRRLMATLPPEKQQSRLALYQLTRKSSSTAVWIAVFLGPFGLHKLYLGQPLSGLLRLLFFWTSIPALLGLIDIFTMPGTVAALNLAEAQRIATAPEPPPHSSRYEPSTSSSSDDSDDSARSEAQLEREDRREEGRRFDEEYRREKEAEAESRYEYQQERKEEQRREREEQAIQEEKWKEEDREAERAARWDEIYEERRRRYDDEES